MTNPPCKGCLDRTLNCHSLCRRYMDWKIIHQAEVESARENREKSFMTRPISDNGLRASWRNLRYANSKRRK